MKQVRFNEEKGYLIDEQGKKYSGRRFSSTWGSCEGTHSIDSAISSALSDLKQNASKKGANAYEITCDRVFDSRQEYDSIPPY